jgi:CRISPR-associated protein Cas8b/Csh1 subtype I-B
MLEIGMRWVQQGRIEGRDWRKRLAQLFRSMLFFEELINARPYENQAVMKVDYGDSEQAKRVRQFFEQASGKLPTDESAQAAFLVGACCSRIEMIQERVRGATPFSGKLKGFRITQHDVERLFVETKEKAKAYGRDEEKKVDGLLTSAACALVVSPERWTLSTDEISYFFALGHALRTRLASRDSEPSTSEQAELR